MRRSFNSRTREGCDDKGKVDDMASGLFQFTHPGGVRRKALLSVLCLLVFQFTHPGGVRRLSTSILCTSFCSFNSRTREGCDGIVPASEATPTSFNSRTREGCDLMSATFSVKYSLFQFTHPGGVRQGVGLNQCKLCQVSIHAPGRGATGVLMHPLPLRCSFNSRTREGCDTSCYRPTARLRSFNSRTREGCDLYSLPLFHILSTFQFTHPGGVRREWSG